MHLILLVLGALCIAAGLVSVWWGFDYPFDDRQALLLRGTVAIIGGLVLVALGSVISHLRRIREAIETVRLAPVVSAAPAPARPDLAQAVAAEPLGKRATERAGRAEVADVGREDRVATSSPQGAPKTVAREPPVPEWPRVAAADRFAPAGANGGTGRDKTPGVIEEPPPTPAAKPPKAEAEPLFPASKPTILKSGVIEGIPYTAYSDGSFEAEFTEGTRRFGSFKELRMHFASRGIG
jgi:hypothetical protein